MPWTSSFGNKYRLCLLDTNALSEIIKNPLNEGRGFVEKCGPKDHVPCLTIYNLIELRRREELFQQYIEFFSYYPSFLLKPVEVLLKEEQKIIDSSKSVEALMHAFSPLGPNSSYNLNKFIYQLFEDPVIKAFENNWREDEKSILEVWHRNKTNFSPKRLEANSQDAERFLNEAGLQFLISLFPEWTKFELDAGRIPKISKFPSLQVSLYSVYYRLFDVNWRQQPQEVTDLRIIAAAPYVDVIITEKFQAEILRKIKGRVPTIQNLEIYKLKDIRWQNRK